MYLTGDLLGNLLGGLFFLLFQLCGCCLACALLPQETRPVKLLTGSVLGTVMLQWLPALLAFALDFTLAAQLFAALLAVLLAGLALFWQKPDLKSLVARPRLSLLQLLPILTFLLFCFLVLHSFRPEEQVVSSSQCTYGDMSMHLGFITSIAEQGTFPPQYSIFPGAQLSYPFLGASISSSLYLFGTTLRFAYILPMLFAGAQVMAGAFLLFRLWLGSAKRALLSFVLFFFCGGFGFYYFLSGTADNPTNFTRIFDSFYETPTNLIEDNIRWVNLIVDMLVPQRATLFGWAVLFTALLFLYKAVYQKQTRYFALVGVLGGALPMIHTHSFLALAIVSIGWLFFDLFTAQAVHKKILVALFFALPLVFSVVQMALGENREHQTLLTWLYLLFILLALTLFGLLLKQCLAGRFLALLRGWGLYLCIVLVLALPQLFLWTLQQATGDQFLRPYFGWGNNGDPYIWFYVKNIGLPALLLLPALCFAKYEKLRVFSPVFLIWIICELVVFQPNPYDNNKLLYVGYLFVCGLVADYLATVYQRLHGLPGRGLLGALILFFCSISAVLTIGRESVAQYDLFGPEEMQLVTFIANNSAPTDVVLTNQRHANGVAALTGRNIVCGSPSYLYYHGLPYQERASDLQRMYESPRDALALFAQYKVRYVVVSNWERGTYSVDEGALATLFPTVYTEDELIIYEVTEALP